MFHIHWPREKIEELLSGVGYFPVPVEFPTATEAERFQYACYNLRRRKQVFLDLTFSREGTVVLVKKKREPEIKVKATVPTSSEMEPA